MARSISLRTDDRAQPARPRILVVDDDDIVCAAVYESLRERYAVATAPHGAAALELLAARAPAVILLDLRMPIMDGWSFVEHYRRIAVAPAPIVLMSGARDLHRLARQLGVAAVLPKPFSPEDVARVVAAQVRPTAPAGEPDASVLRTSVAEPAE